MNCDGYITGVTSWGVAGIEEFNGTNRLVCLQSYPSVYTRTSSFLDWISDNSDIGIRLD